MSALLPIESVPNEIVTNFRNTWSSVPTTRIEVHAAIAEAGIKRAYIAAGLSPPDRIVWARSPFEIERSRRANWLTWAPGVGVKDRLLGNVVDRVSRAIRSNGLRTLEADVRRTLRFPAGSNSAARFVDQEIFSEMASVRWPLRTLVSAAMVRMAGRPLGATLTPFSGAAWGQLEYRETLGMYRFIDDCLGPSAAIAPLAGLFDVALHAGWVVAHERVCWMSERAVDLAVDAHGRLHSETGPALSFRDGWKRYFWKGVEIPDWFIEHREYISPESIARVNDPILRACMIEIMGPERFISTGAAACVSEDRAGRLWRANWGLDTWHAVEVINGTPEPDGSYKHYLLQVPPEMRTPGEAVAWTYGISPQRYAELSLRT